MEIIVTGLSLSMMISLYKCFFFPVAIFQIMETILLSSKKTGLHDDVLRVLYLHMDPLLPLPRLRMLSVIFRSRYGFRVQFNLFCL